LSVVSGGLHLAEWGSHAVQHWGARSGDEEQRLRVRRKTQGGERAL
jgi:hypothetical protein